MKLHGFLVAALAVALTCSFGALDDAHAQCPVIAEPMRANDIIADAAEFTQVVVDDRLLAGNRREKIRRHEQRLQSRGLSRADRAQASYQLARLLAADGNLARASEFARLAASHAASPPLKRRASLLAQRLTRQERIAESERGLATARVARREQRFADAEAVLTALASRPCPYKPDFQHRVRLARAELAIDQNQFDIARTHAQASLGWDVPSRLRSKARTLLDKADVREDELAVRQALQNADAESRRGQLDAAIALIEEAKRDNGRAGPAVLMQATFKEAALRRWRGDREGARTLLTLAASDADAEGALLDRARREVLRHDLALARTDADAGRGDHAFAVLDALSANAVGDAERAEIALTRARLWLAVREPRRALEALAGWRSPDATLEENARVVTISAYAALAAGDPQSERQLSEALAQVGPGLSAQARVAVAEALLRQGFETMAAGTLTQAPAADTRGADLLDDAIPFQPASVTTAATPEPTSLSAEANARLSLARARLLRARGEIVEARHLLIAASAALGTDMRTPDAAALQFERAALEADLGDAVAARALLTPWLSSQWSKARQDAVDGLLHVHVAEARIRAANGDYKGGLVAVSKAVADAGEATPTAVARARLAAALIAADAEQYADAAILIEAVGSTDVALASAVLDTRRQVAQRQSDSSARARMARASTAAYVGDTSGALALLEALAADATVSQRWRDQADVYRARVLIGAQRFGEAEATLTAISTRGVSPQVERQLSLARDELTSESAGQRWSGFVAVGGGYETNAPGRRSALRLEDEAAPFPLDQDIEDYFARYAVEAVYRARFGENASHLRARVGVEAIDQAELSPLDTLNVEASLGPVFHLPGAETFVAVSGVYRDQWRGGDHFATETGVAVEARSQAPEQGELYGALEWVRRQDKRSGQDGDYYDALLGYQHRTAQRGRIGAEVDVERGHADRERSRYWAPGVKVSVSQALPSWRGLDASLEAHGRARYVDYDGRTPVPGGSDRERLERRYQAGVGVSVRPRPEWSVEGGYTYLRQSSNIPGRTRDDHLIAIGVQRKF